MPKLYNFISLPRVWHLKFIVITSQYSEVGRPIPTSSGEISWPGCESLIFLPTRDYCSYRWEWEASWGAYQTYTGL